MTTSATSFAAVRVPVRTWGLYGVAVFTAVTSLSPDNVPLAVTTLVLGLGVVLAARMPLHFRNPQISTPSEPS
jgi:hypothetical protein